MGIASTGRVNALGIGPGSVVTKLRFSAELWRGVEG